MKTNEEIIQAAKESKSIAQVLTKLGLKAVGGNYRIIKRRFKELNIDTSHFTGQGHLKGKTHGWNPKIPLEDILVDNSSYKTFITQQFTIMKLDVLKNFDTLNATSEGTFTNRV